MPRAQVRWFWFFFYMVYFVEVDFGLIYRIISIVIPVSEDEWTDGLLAGLLILAFGTYWYLRAAPDGTIEASGIRIAKDQVIPFEKVERIVSEGRGFPAVIFTATGRKRVRLPNEAYAGLAKTVLNQWVIDGDKINVTAGETGQALRIEYAPAGKYKTFRFETPYALLVYPMFAMVLLRAYEGRAFLYWGVGLVLFIGILDFINCWYRRVRVSVEGDAIQLEDENKAKRSLRFNDIAEVEKGWLQTRVKAKSGEVVYFPQACIILPELIEEFAGLKEV